MDRDALVCESYDDIGVNDPDHESEFGIEAGPSAHTDCAEHPFGRVSILAPKLERPANLLERIQEAALQDTKLS
jgi:hypothetical protein